MSGNDLQRINLDVAQQSTPVDATPFNELARFFGAAGTVMMLLNSRGFQTADRLTIRQYIRDGFWANGQDFCREVEELIFSYYSNQDNRTRSEGRITAMRERLASGE